jgi:hypothetical protein
VAIRDGFRRRDDSRQRRLLEQHRQFLLLPPGEIQDLVDNQLKFARAALERVA